MHRIRRRDLFSFVGEVLLSPAQHHLVLNRGRQAKVSLLEIIACSEEESAVDDNERIVAEDIICQVVKMGYGKGGKNPVLVQINTSTV